MEIIVCIRRAPTTDARIKPGPDGKTFDPAGINYDISEYDKFALEAAIEMKEKHGGKATVLSLGPAAVSKELRTAVAMGCDAAALLVSDASHDSWAVANALAAKLKTMPHDLVLFGWNSVDNQSAATGQMVAELLGLPCVSVAVALEIKDGVAHVERLAAGGNRERLAVKLPAVITCQKGLNKPRQPNMKGLMNAKKTVIDESPAGAPANGVAVTRMDPPPPRPAGKIVGKGPDAARALVNLLRNEAKVI
ncbi:MAG: electron transfer flavoprotein subunit beta/FixA family protein [Planctomycetes bacterium]|jgi:electron transfer flavoprotein beta subunit|nr:electron transfer flavoprotein subunit beta/FixA family protein [Planctomycetota bacterium]MCL4730824.1 electron transfer flavoprotein subunit beta/FixA family protein [Planctomycetota bacterium]